MESAVESVSEGFEILSLFDEVDPLGVSDWRFIVLEHGFGVDDEMVEVLLHGTSDEADEET